MEGLERVCDRQDDGEAPYLSPSEVMEIEIKGINWKKMSGVMKGKGELCWKCFEWGTFLTCKNCARHYHRLCVFMVPGFPEPIFDKPVEQVRMEGWGKVDLLKCPNCLVEEETRVCQLSKVPLKELNSAFSKMAHYFTRVSNFEELLDPFIDETGVKASFHLKKICEKATNENYKTVEEFYADFRAIKYKISKTHSTAKCDECNMVVEQLMNLVGAECGTLIACVECYSKRWDSIGKIRNIKEYVAPNLESCMVPHPVIWVKIDSYPFWPAKLLAVDKETLIFQCFRESAVARRIFLHGNCARTYSERFPERKLPKDQKTWSAAISDCKKYLDKLRNRFGQGGVVIPVDSAPFDGDVEALRKTVFPFYQARVPDAELNHPSNMKLLVANAKEE